ncbi:hypothetical protein P9112_009662 [Eukaryota sp. TZLM1-RC]
MTSSLRERFLLTTSSPLPPVSTGSTSPSPALESQIAHLHQRLDALEHHLSHKKPSTPRSFTPSQPSRSLENVSSSLQALHRSHCLLDKHVSTTLHHHLDAIGESQDNIVRSVKNYAIDSGNAVNGLKSKVDEMMSRIVNLESHQQSVNQSVSDLTVRLQSLEQSNYDVIDFLRNLADYLENENTDSSPESEVVIKANQDANQSQSVSNENVTKNGNPNPNHNPNPNPVPVKHRSKSMSHVMGNQTSQSDRHSNHSVSQSNPNYFANQSFDDVDVSIHDTKFGSQYLRDVWTTSPLPLPVTSADLTTTPRDRKPEGDLDPKETDDVVIGPVDLEAEPRLPSYPLPIIPQSNLIDRRKKGLLKFFKSSGVRNPVLERRRKANRR